MKRARLYAVAITVLALSNAAGAAGAQTVTGVVRDSAGHSPLRGASITILAGQGGPAAIATSDSTGRFRVDAPSPGSYTIEVRRLGYASKRAPITVPATLTADDSVDCTIELARSTTRVDTGRVSDSLARHLFQDSPGRVLFEQHMALGKGHFFAGGDIEKSGLPLSAFLATFDFMTLVPKVDMNTPVVPAAHAMFLTTTTTHKCLNARIDRTSLPETMLLRQRENIDELLPATEIFGIELYLSPGEVPPDMQPDAFAVLTDMVARPGSGSYSMGVVGGYDRLVQRGLALARPPLLPKCPLIQIWTRAAW